MTRERTGPADTPTRRLGALLAVVAILAAACGGSATPAPSSMKAWRFPSTLAPLSSIARRIAAISTTCTDTPDSSSC